MDHAGGLRHFTGVPVHCQRRELEYGLTDATARHAIYRIDFDDPTHDWRLAEGDVSPACYRGTAPDGGPHGSAGEPAPLIRVESPMSHGRNEQPVY